MKRALFALLCVCTLVATAGCMNNGDDAPTTLTIQSFLKVMQNLNVTHDTEKKYVYGDLPSLETNDTVNIADTIQQVYSLPEYNVTGFRFVSMPNASLYVEGNQSGIYAAGDNIDITFHITEDVFYHPDQTNYTGWHISLEVVQEIYDQTYHQYSMIMPPYAIKKSITGCRLAVRPGVKKEDKQLKS